MEKLPFKTLSVSAVSTIVGGIAWLTTLHNDVDAHTIALDAIRASQSRTAELVSARLGRLADQVSRVDAKLQLLLDQASSRRKKIIPSAE